MHPIRRSLTLLALAVTPAAAASQPTSRPAESQDPIPRELALALLNLGPGLAGGADIRVGKAPDDIPPELVPPGLQVLGSTTRFEASVIVLVAPQQPDSAIASVEAHLLAAGWTKPAVPAARPQRGFVSADIGQVNSERPDMVCRGNEFVWLSGTYRRSGGSVVKLSYNRGQQYSPCKTREDAGQYRSPYEEAPMPLLRAPQGSIAGTSGGDMTAVGANSIGIATRLRTRLKPAEVAAHYDKQMREQGWASVADGAVEILAARSYRKNDDKGRTWTAMLFAMTLPDAAELDVSLRLNRK